MQGNGFPESGRLIASPWDRFSAAILDAVILTPIVSLAAAPLEMLSITQLFTGESELYVYMNGLRMGVLFLVAWMYHAFCWWKFSATPGERFWGLEVCEYPSLMKMTALQASMRALWYLLCLIPLATPLLALWRHPLRRTFYDRATDTIVRPRAFGWFLPPSRTERRIVSLFQGSSFAAALIICFVIATQEVSFRHRNVLERCDLSEVTTLVGPHVSRVDLALSLFLQDALSERCMRLTGERFYRAHGNPIALAAIAITADASFRDNYVHWACDQEQNVSACRSLRILNAFYKQDWSMLGQLLLSVTENSPLYERVLALQQAVRWEQKTKIKRLLSSIPHLPAFYEISLKGRMTLARLNQDFSGVYQMWMDARWNQKIHQRLSFSSWLCRWELEVTKADSRACRDLSLLSEKVSERNLEPQWMVTLWRWQQKNPQGGPNLAFMEDLDQAIRGNDWDHWLLRSESIVAERIHFQLTRRHVPPGAIARAYGAWKDMGSDDFEAYRFATLTLKSYAQKQGLNEVLSHIREQIPGSHVDERIPASVKTKSSRGDEL